MGQGIFLAAWTQIPTPATGLVRYVNFARYEDHVKVISRDNAGREVMVEVPLAAFPALITEARSSL